MAVIALQIGTVPIQLTAGFESQGFTVTEVTGLSEYGEHKLGIPGSNEVTILGNILPGVNPVDIRAYMYGSVNPYEPFMIQAIHSNGHILQSTALISSIKCDVNANPCTITVTILRSGGWYGDFINKQLDQDNEHDSLIGNFEFLSPVTLEIQLTSAFSQTELAGSTVKVIIGGTASITVDFQRLKPILAGLSVDLNEGSIIRVITSLDYHAYLLTAGRIFELPVLGNVDNGMVPVSTNPTVKLEATMASPECSVDVVLKTRETFLMT